MESRDLVREANQKLFNLLAEEKDLKKVLELGEELLQTPVLYYNHQSDEYFVSKDYSERVSENKDWNENYLNILKYSNG